MDQTTNVNTNAPGKGLITDLHDNLVSKEIWTHARNAQMNSHLGQTLFLQNEPSTKHCVDLPYTPIGFIKLLNDRWAVFATDEEHSEIGIFDEKNCTYETLVKSSCLNLSAKNPVMGISKENFDCSETIYWTDNRNPRRFLKLNNIPYKYTFEDDTCETKKYTNELDCDELLLEPKIKVPYITPRLSVSGNLKNGVYQFAIAYTQNQSRITEFYAVSKLVRVWSHENMGQSIELSIDNIDKDFDQFELAVIFTENESTSYKSLGLYSTATNNILVSNITRSEYSPLDLKDILARRVRYPYAALVTSNDEYALWANVTTRPELNYQPQAMNIQAEYIVKRVPEDYYAKGGVEVGYERDEVYAFGIQWLFADGSWSPVYHIPGRVSKDNETALASGSDVYEYQLANTTQEHTIKVWQVENTADDPHKVINDTIVAKGAMGYWESTDTYPNNNIYGESKCTPIRHHKFPDNTKVPNHAEEGKYIDILGVRFNNIERPRLSNGKYATDVVGYRIVRGDRKNDRSVIAKGLISNVRGYKEVDGSTVYYPNYPYNDLRPDTFISSKQTVGKAGKESNFAALTEYYNDKFNFHSPHALFANTSLGDELRVYSEEIADVKGNFEKVYKHPRQKLLTQFDLYFALIIGALDGYYAQAGKKCTTVIGPQTFDLGTIQTPAGPTPPQMMTIRSAKMEQACDDALSFTSGLTVNKRQLRPAERVLRVLARAGVFAYFTLQTAQKVLDIIANFSPWQDYGLQYNSVGNFNKSIPVNKDQRRRHIEYYQYIRDGINTVEGTSFNNFKRETSVFLRLHKDVDTPKTQDNSRGTVTDFGICNNIFKPVKSTASMYHVGVKRKVPNQYGSLSGIRYLDTGFFDYTLKNTEPQGSNDVTYKTEEIFGGDTFINRLGIKRSHHYFSLFLHDAPDGYILDYRMYRNVGYPRYWIDTTPYDLSGFVALRPSQGRTPANKHNLNCGVDALSSVTIVKDRYFYLFNSGVINFFVESDFNLDLRDWKLHEPTFYSRNYANTSNLFRSDKIEKVEEFVYDRTYSKQLTENLLVPQSPSYDPVNAESCQSNIKNRVIYSNKASHDQKADNWRVYLPLNYYDFPMTEFGQLTALKPVDNQQIMFLFDKSSPYITVGRDEIKLDGSGNKITIGDGGLLSRDPRPVVYTDSHYGNSQSRWAFNVTQYGIFYPSQRQGRLFKYGSGLDDVARNGMHYWFKNNLPSKLVQQFPNLKRADNPINGVAVQSAFDSTNEVYYVCKKDYIASDGVTYDETKDKFFFGNWEIELGDPNYFKDASWTLSYDLKTGTFVSFHDWHPDWTIQSEKRFLTVKNNSIWRHNERWDSFCNFYNQDYPFEIEYVVNNGQNAEILRSIEYHLDFGKYFNQGKDFHQILDGNFDEAIIHNNEQCSGLLKLFLRSKRDLTQMFNFPKVNKDGDAINVLYDKEEQKHRLNMFTDVIRDRGEFTLRNYPIWITGNNGYTKELNPIALDLTKPVQHQKKFRGLWHKILLRKLVSGENKIIFKFANSKETTSFR